MLLGVLTSDAWAALAGAAVGWVLGLGTDLVRDVVRARRQRQTAARIVYAELISNYAAASALQHFGSLTKASLRRIAWDAYGHDLLYKGDLNRVGRITMAYNSIADVEDLASDAGRDWAQGDDKDLMDQLLSTIREGAIEVGQLTELGRDEVVHRLDAAAALAP